MKRGRQGTLFRIRLGKHHLSLWFLGFLPVAWIRLTRVVSITQSFRGDIWEGGARRWFCPWRYWIWPGAPRGGRANGSIFVIETRGGTRVWVCLRAGLHYQLRAAVHEAVMRRRDKPCAVT